MLGAVGLKGNFDMLFVKLVRDFENATTADIRVYTFMPI